MVRGSIIYWFICLFIIILFILANAVNPGMHITVNIQLLCVSQGSMKHFALFHYNKRTSCDFVYTCRVPQTVQWWTATRPWPAGGDCRPCAAWWASGGQGRSWCGQWGCHNQCRVCGYREALSTAPVHYCKSCALLSTVYWLVPLDIWILVVFVAVEKKKCQKSSSSLLWYFNEFIYYKRTTFPKATQVSTQDDLNLCASGHSWAGPQQPHPCSTFGSHVAPLSWWCCSLACCSSANLCATPHANHTPNPPAAHTVGCHQGMDGWLPVC